MSALNLLASESHHLSAIAEEVSTTITIQDPPSMTQPFADDSRRTTPNDDQPRFAPWTVLPIPVPYRLRYQKPGDQIERMRDFLQTFDIQLQSHRNETTGLNEHEFSKIQECLTDYHPANIYNLAVTDLYHIITVEGKVAEHRVARMTVAFIFNSDGSDRLQPMFVGEHRAPECFPEVVDPKHKNWAHHYLYEPTAAISPDIFENLLRVLDGHVQRQIVLLVDKALFPVYNRTHFHHLDADYIIPLPRCGFSNLQPLSPAILYCLHNNCKASLQSFVKEGDFSPLNELQIVQLCVTGWERIPKQILANGWKPLIPHKSPGQ